VDAKILNVFVESVTELFSQMLSCNARLSKASLANPVIARQDLVGLIGLTGAMRGTVALVLPAETARTITHRFIGSASPTDEELTDTGAELVNILAGGAKAKLRGTQEPITLGLPNVIRSKGQTVLSPASATWLELTFISELGDFNVRVTMSK
jgi:CheY-specific phosphatase CheX